MGGANTVPRPNIKHFIHPHILELSSFQCQQGQTNPSILCSCCKLTASEKVCICRPCNFILHSNCSQFPEHTTHGAHGNHTLTLLPTSPYGSGKFGCDACGNQVNGFTYHCSTCRYDLHPTCAFKPLKFTHQFHACPLALTFKDPCTTNKCFACDICGKSIGSNKWRYRCSKCDFDVHLGCTKASPASRAGGSGTSNIPHRPAGPGFIQGAAREVGSSLAHGILRDIGSNSSDGNYDHHHRTVDQGGSDWDGDQTRGFIDDDYYQGTVDQDDSIWDGDDIGGFTGDFFDF